MCFCDFPSFFASSSCPYDFRNGATPDRGKGIDRGGADEPPRNDFAAVFGAFALLACRFGLTDFIVVTFRLCHRYRLRCKPQGQPRHGSFLPSGPM